MFESLVRNCSNFLPVLGGLGLYDGKGDDGGSLGAGVQGLGNLLGLFSLTYSSSDRDLRERFSIALERDTSRVSRDLKESLASPFAHSFRGAEGGRDGALILLGRKELMKCSAGADVPLGLGSSCDSPCIPREVAGLDIPVFDRTRPCAKGVFGRPRLCSDCGRTPVPTLAENELLDVCLEAVEFDLLETEEENEVSRLGPFIAVALTDELTFVEEGGAGRVFFNGSPAFSTNVLLFGAGSGTGYQLSGRQFTW